MRKYFLFALAILTLVMTAAVSAQNNAEQQQIESSACKEPPVEAKFFWLNFLVKQLDDGKVVNTRSYASMASTQGKTLSLRTSDRIPHDGLDFGVGIDAYSFSVKGNEIIFSLTIDLTDATIAQNSPGETNAPTVVKQNRWSSTVKTLSGKSTVIYTVDDPRSKKSVQVEVTATVI